MQTQQLISTIENPYADDLSLGGRPGTEVDRIIGSVRCLLVQLDSRIGHAKHTLAELEGVRSRLIGGLQDLTHAGS